MATATKAWVRSILEGGQVEAVSLDLAPPLPPYFLNFWNLAQAAVVQIARSAVLGQCQKTGDTPSTPAESGFHPRA